MSNNVLKLKTTNWRVKSHHRQHQLVNRSTAKLGWQRLVIIAKNSTAEQILESGTDVLVRQNHQLQGVPMYRDDPRKLSLVFYRHNPLQTLTLDWIGGKDALEAPLFSVTIKPISAAKAWFFMLKSVSKKAKERGDQALQIYRITRARQKRQGKVHALRKLVQAYQPLLQHQLTSCEPFNYWRLHHEPSCHQQLLAHSSVMPALSCLPLQLEEPLDNEAWYFYDSERFNKARQFTRLVKASASIAEQEHATFVYWDHDKLDSSEQRVLPNFKPDWNLDLILSSDYIGPCFAVKGRLLRQVQQQAVSQHWDHYQLILGLMTLKEQFKACHVPVILEHEAQTKITSADDELKYQSSIQQYLVAAEPNTQVSFASNIEADVRKINFAVQTSANEQPTVSIIVPTRNALSITKNCIDSVLTRTSLTSFEILIVDNQSSDPDTLNWFKEISKHPKVCVLKYDAPFNYSAINNYAVNYAKGSYLCFLNNDTEVITDDWLAELLQHAQRPQVGCVGAKLFYPDNTIQHAGVILGPWGLAGHAHKNFTRHANGYNNRLAATQNYSAVTAACMMVSKQLFQQVGGFNEQDLTVAFNDVDLCLKVLKAGYRNVWTPYAELYHYESKSRGKEDSPSKKAREQKEIQYMKHCWGNIIDNDPAYNPNLTRTQEDFGVNLDPHPNILPTHSQNFR